MESKIEKCSETKTSVIPKNSKNLLFIFLVFHHSAGKHVSLYEPPYPVGKVEFEYYQKIKRSSLYEWQEVSQQFERLAWDNYFVYSKG